MANSRSLINQAIRNFVGGVSQQPTQLRYPEQFEEQINGLSTDASGLQKRPPTLHIAKLAEATDTIKPLVHFYKRDESEKYCMIFNGTGVTIYDLNGNYKTVHVEGMSNSYITTTNPRQDLKCVTIADYTFIVNRKVKAALTTDTGLDYYALQGALIHVKGGQYGRKYEVIIDGVSKASFTTPDGSATSDTTKIDTNYIATQLYTALVAAGYTCTTGESWIHINSQGINSIETKDGYNNQSMYGIQKSVQKFTMLPATAPNNYVCQVIGEVESNADNYYVQYNASKKAWIECVQPALHNEFDGMTMPNVIIRNSDGTFTLKQATWAKRAAGDLDSNPEPSFVGKNINDVFFYRNRLGFIADENVILTKSAEFFDFWMASAVEVQDTDPIDGAASDPNSVTSLRHAVPFKQDLLLFSDNAQFILTSNGALSPKNYNITLTTTYNSSTKAKPVGAGKNVYFTTERAKYTTVKEYFTALDDTSNKDAQDVSGQIPNYIPNGVYKLVSSTVENVILLLTEGQEDTAYVYKYLFINGQRLQSSWSKWNFKGDVWGAEFLGSELYLLMYRDGDMYLEKVIFTYNTIDYAAEPYRIHLDRKVVYTIPPEAYSSTDNLTTIDLKTPYDVLALPQGIEHGVVTEDGVFWRLIPNVDELALIGNLVGQKVIIGQLFNVHIDFSPFMLKTKDEQGITAETSGRLQLRNFWLNYENSSFFKVTVASDNGTFQYDMTGKRLDNIETQLDSMINVSGIFKIPIQMQNTKCHVSIDSDATGALTLSGGGWDGVYYSRSRTIK